GVLAGPHDILLDILLGLGDDFFDSARVNTTVFHQHFHGLAGNLAADRIKAAKHHVAGRVVDHDVDAGGALQRLNVSTLLTDDATFHLIILQLNASDGALG